MGRVPKNDIVKFIFCDKNICMIKEEQKKQRESHVKLLRLLRLEKAIQSIPYPSVERLMKELYKEEVGKMWATIT